jgi:hypothetical protein
VSVDQLSGQFYRILSGYSCAQQKRQEFTVGQRLRAPRQQPLARPVPGRHVPHA